MKKQAVKRRPNVTMQKARIGYNDTGTGLVMGFADWAIADERDERSATRVYASDRLRSTTTKEETHALDAEVYEILLLVHLTARKGIKPQWIKQIRIDICRILVLIFVSSFLHKITTNFNTLVHFIIQLFFFYTITG